MISDSLEGLSEMLETSTYYNIFFFFCKITIFDLITAHTHLSAQSSNFIVFRLQPVYFYLYFFIIKAHVVDTHLNCLPHMHL